MKHKCSDGIDRDVHIDNYLLLEKRLDMVKKRTRNLQAEENGISQELTYVGLNWLGSPGYSALERARETQ